MTRFVVNMSVSIQETVFFRTLTPKIVKKSRTLTCLVAERLCFSMSKKSSHGKNDRSFKKSFDIQNE